MISGTSIANYFYCLLNRGKHRHFYRSASQLKTIQEKYLMKLLQKNRHTEFGKKYQFDKIKSISEYQQLVPLFEYEALQPFIFKIMKGQKNIRLLNSIYHPFSPQHFARIYLPTKQRREENKI